jgi:hypothetical protein
MLNLRLRFAAWLRSASHPVFAFLYLLFGLSLVALFWVPPEFGFLSVLILALASTLLFWRYLDATYTPIRMANVFPGAGQWPVFSRLYPLYKWVDLYRAAAAVSARHSFCMELQTEHSLALRQLLQGRFAQNVHQPLKPPTMVARKVGLAGETFLPVDSFWLVRGNDSLKSGAIIRVRLLQRQSVILEVATEQKADADSVIGAILDHAAANSIYRNHVISPVFQGQVKAVYGDDESNAGFDLAFQPEHDVTEKDIILDDAVQPIIERTIIDFHRRRAELMRLGLPGRRGVLFYGPPGTGKTYTCKYIAHTLRPATTIVAVGQALLHVHAICDLAKMFQPSLVILEDIDLMFAQRDINPYTPVLGELLDELDGFRADDQVIFILTTNALERVESAIKDRPGRISQCIYFGPPSASLRQRYIQVLSQPYDITAVNLDQVVARTDGVSQAFLKELVFRAVQISTQERDGHSPTVALTQEDFAAALTEMTTGVGRWGKRIIGFQV